MGNYNNIILLENMIKYDKNKVKDLLLNELDLLEISEKFIELNMQNDRENLFDLILSSNNSELILLTLEVAFEKKMHLENSKYYNSGRQQIIFNFNDSIVNKLLYSTMSEDIINLLQKIKYNESDKSDIFHLKYNDCNNFLNNLVNSLFRLENNEKRDEHLKNVFKIVSIPLFNKNELSSSHISSYDSVFNGFKKEDYYELFLNILLEKQYTNKNNFYQSYNETILNKLFRSFYSVDIDKYIDTFQYLKNKIKKETFNKYCDENKYSVLDMLFHYDCDKKIMKLFKNITIPFSYYLNHMESNNKKIKPEILNKLNFNEEIEISTIERNGYLKDNIIKIFIELNKKNMQNELMLIKDSVFHAMTSFSSLRDYNKIINQKENLDVDEMENYDFNRLFELFNKYIEVYNLDKDNNEIKSAISSFPELEKHYNIYCEKLLLIQSCNNNHLINIKKL